MYSKYFQFFAPIFSSIRLQIWNLICPSRALAKIYSVHYHDFRFHFDDRQMKPHKVFEILDPGLSSRRRYCCDSRTVIKKRVRSKHPCRRPAYEIEPVRDGAYKRWQVIELRINGWIMFGRQVFSRLVSWSESLVQNNTNNHRQLSDLFKPDSFRQRSSRL